MKTFVARRQASLVLLLLIAVALGLLHAVFQVAMIPDAHLTGWVLLGIILFLAAYNVRKKIPFLPLMRSSTWLQLHIYVGLISGLLFVIHLSLRLPTGIFESLLALAYLSVFFSGVGGLFLSRTIPARLTSRGPEVLYERIPTFIRDLREQAEKLVFECLAETETTAVPNLYLHELQPFFAKPRNFWRHLMHSEIPKRKLLQALKSQERFLIDTERTTTAKLAKLVQQKDDLDYQYAMQSVLKYWLFLHIPLTYALLVFAFFHMLSVTAFTGGF